MPGPAACHHQVAVACVPQAALVFADATALDTVVPRRAPEPTLVQGLLGHGLFQSALLTAGGLGRPEELDLWERALCTPGPSLRAVSSLWPARPKGDSSWRKGEAVCGITVTRSRCWRGIRDGRRSPPVA
jgi:hypothetical protein